MRKIVFLIQICLIIVLLSACSSEPGKLSKDEMHQIVDSNNILLKKYFESQDIESLANMYSDSAKLSPNGDDFVIGRDKIKAFWMDDFKTAKVLDMQTTTLTVDGNSNLIYETGKTTSKILYMDSIYTPTVKFINVWVKQPDGKFHLDVDFWNKDEIGN